MSGELSMEINEEAKKILERKIARAVNSIDLEQKEQQDIKNELLSHFYDASYSIAQSRGSNTIDKEDVERAFAELESPEDIAKAYMKTHVDSFVRAGLFSRSAAYIIDIIMVFFLVLILIVPFLIPFGIVSFTPVNGNDPGMGIILPGMGFGIFFATRADGMLETMLTVLGSVGTLVIFITYFIVIEGRFGYTPGKRLLSLKVLKEDGTKITYKESIIRNIPKFISNLIILDAILMVILYRKDRQRVFDKVASTIVIHMNKKQ